MAKDPRSNAIACLRAAKEVYTTIFVGGGDHYGRTIMDIADRLPITKAGAPDSEEEIAAFVSDLRESLDLAREIFGRVDVDEVLGVYDRVYDLDE